MELLCQKMIMLSVSLAVMVWKKTPRGWYKKIISSLLQKNNQKSLIFSTSIDKCSTDLNNSAIYFHLKKEKSLFYYFISRIMHEKPSNLQLLNKKYLRRTYLHKGTLSLPENDFCFLYCFINSLQYLPSYHMLLNTEKY